ncbi:MAG TPA: S49 family peptidase, partial [Candidatus Krumholzibacteria bacterium]|nr:S49 family peptidase [Candidatus Krumholzibacteria bacterium]
MHREPSFFRRLVHSVALTVCTLVVIVALVAGGAWLASQKQGKVDKGAWLVLDLYGEVHEYDPPGGPLGAVMGGDALTLQDMLDNLGKAARDKRIKGVIFHVSASNSCGFAKLQELRGAVDRVQAAGKPVYAWADALDLPSLWLAAGCDKVMMPTGGYVSFTGLHRQRVYVRAMLDKLGIVPHLHKIKDYKAAAEMIMDTHASEAAKANMNWLMDDVWETLLADLGRERGLDRDALYAAMTYAEFMPDEARATGLIDET